MTTKHHREKRLLTLLFVTFLSAIYVVYALAQPLAALSPTVDYHFSQQATQASLEWPTYGEAAVGAVGYGVLTTHGSSQPVPTASTIKLLTALAVLQKMPLGLSDTGPIITITQDDVDSYHKFLAQDGSVVAVTLGEGMSEYDALEALLLPSANNIAETLARWSFGSIDSFTAYANNYAQELGMTDTVVTDPSGFSPTTVSTAHDLVVLGEAAIANPVIAEIVNKKTATIPVQGTIANVNFLLGQDGIVGIKTGNNDQDQGAFVSASKQTIQGQVVTVVDVVMGAPRLWTAMQDSVTLLNSAVANFAATTVTQQTAIATYTTPWGVTATATAAKPYVIVFWRGTDVQAHVLLSTLHVPTKAGSSVGSLSFIAQGQTLATVPLVLEHPLNEPGITWRLSHPEHRG